jgi:hypothetical protein
MMPAFAERPPRWCEAGMGDVTVVSWKKMWLDADGWVLRRGRILARLREGLCL